MRIAPVWECRECPYFDAHSKDNRYQYFRNSIAYMEYDGLCYHPTQKDKDYNPRRIEGLSAGQFPEWCELEVIK